MKPVKYRSAFSHLFYICIALTLFASCENDDFAGLTYEEVAEFGSFFGDPNFATVILYLQDGPYTTPQRIEEIEPTSQLETNMNLLYGEMASEALTEKLSGLDLSSLTVILSTEDEELGPPSEIEKSFLNSQNAQAMEVQSSAFSGIT